MVNITMSRAQHSNRFIGTAFGLFIFFLVGGVGIIYFAASSSLPGDALFPLKIKREKTQINYTDDAAVQAWLYLQFAEKRLFEMQSLIERRRYLDLVLATSNFTKNIQQAQDIVRNESQIVPAQASALNTEILLLLRSYRDLLARNLASIPSNLQPVIEKVNLASHSSASHSYNQNNGSEGSSGQGDPDVLPTMTPIIIILSTSTPMNSPEFTD